MFADWLLAGVVWKGYESLDVYCEVYVGESGV